MCERVSLSLSLPLLHPGTKHPLLCQLGVRFSLDAPAGGFKATQQDV